jgi:hypothetical protein
MVEQNQSTTLVCFLLNSWMKITSIGMNIYTYFLYVYRTSFKETIGHTLF